jgi:exopolyphosphatase/guanosine-5'-triphosphate,3'-diphosphate pyrophosphatase
VKAPAEKPPVPRVAAVDVGSNALRFVAAEPAADGYRALATDRFPLRLGREAFSRGELSAETVSEALRCLAAFTAEMETLGIERRRAVATAALRECRNRAELVRRARRDAGLRLEIISGPEEIRLAHLAVRHRLPSLPEPWLQVELGGGSVEIALADRGGIRWNETHPLGAVRLLEVLGVSGDDPRGARTLVAEYIETLRVPARVMAERPRALVATGGNIETLARHWGREDGKGRAIGRDELARAVEQLGRLTVAERVRKLGLGADRADVILPAALVYHRIAESAGADLLLAPGVGLRDGLVLDLLAGDGSLPVFPDRSLEEACRRLGSRYEFDERHGRQVARLADQLFRELAPLHGLGVDARRLLAAAALLHDIGGYISFENHHKHSQYLISQSELPGVSPDEMQVVANVARYHRKRLPTPEHEPFARLDEADRETVRRLAAVLRLADALDRQHRGLVRSVRASVGEREVVLAVEAAGDLAVERWSLARKANLFTEVFGRQVRLEGNGVTA